jgi:hypothetical protein
LRLFAFLQIKADLGDSVPFQGNGPQGMLCGSGRRDVGGRLFARFPRTHTPLTSPSEANYIDPEIKKR